MKTDVGDGRRLATGKISTRVVVAVAAAAVLLAGVIVVAAMPHGHHAPNGSAGGQPCGSVHCAAGVNTVQRSPRVTVFFGKSCAGLHGDWFLNAVQGGAAQIVHAAYYLRWTFAPNVSKASPSGRVAISGGTGAFAATLVNGALKVTGTSSGGGAVSGSGTLLVELTGTASAPTLTITETGLTATEQTIGLLSPFNVGGQPLTIPISLSDNRSGC